MRQYYPYSVNGIAPRWADRIDKMITLLLSMMNYKMNPGDRILEQWNPYYTDGITDYYIPVLDPKFPFWPLQKKFECEIPDLYTEYKQVVSVRELVVDKTCSGHNYTGTDAVLIDAALQKINDKIFILADGSTLNAAGIMDKTKIGIECRVGGQSAILGLSFLSDRIVPWDSGNMSTVKIYPNVIGYKPIDDAMYYIISFNENPTNGFFTFEYVGPFARIT